MEIVMIDLREFEDVEDIKTIAEAIGQIYKDKIIQVYWGESGGVINYADFDINQNMYLEGRVLWGRGDVFAVEVDYQINGKDYKKQVIFNAWGVTMIAEKTDNLNVTVIFLGKT
jgi:hypothetical protein